MKTLKRVLSMTLVCLLLCGLLPSFALADDPVAGAMVLTDVTGKPGDTVTVDLKLTSNPGIVVLQIKSLTFDSTVLELTDVAVTIESGWNPTVVKETGRILLDKDPTANSTYTGSVATYTFKILDTAAAGETEIKLDYSACDKDEKYVTFNVTPAKVTVKGETGKVDFPFNHSASFDNNLSLIYYMPSEYVEGYELDRLQIRQVHYTGEGSDFEWREYNLTSWADVKVSGKDYKRLVFDNIAAKEIGDELYATLYLTKDGVSYENTVDVYNLKTYAYNRLSKSSDASFKTLLVDMLNYGAQAQVYFNYNTGNPVNQDLTPEQQAMGTADMPTLKSVENTIATPDATAFYYGKTIVMGSYVELSYYMQFGANKDEAPADTVKLVLSYTKINGQTVSVTIPASEFVYNPSRKAYSANFSGISAKDMRCTVTAKIYDGDTLISDVLEYSIETYAKNRLEKSSDEVFKELMRCLMKYGISAENYLN